MSIAARLATLERWRRPSLGPVMLHVTFDYRGRRAGAEPAITVPGVAGVLDRAAYEGWADAQWQQAQAAGRSFRIYVSELCDRPPAVQPEDLSGR
jgi:hypothetical protein